MGIIAKFYLPWESYPWDTSLEQKPGHIWQDANVSLTRVSGTNDLKQVHANSAQRMSPKVILEHLEKSKVIETDRKWFKKRLKSCYLESKLTKLCKETKRESGK